MPVLAISFRLRFRLAGQVSCIRENARCARAI
jgi:hypothetical protein